MPARCWSSSAAFGSSLTRRARHSCPTGGNDERDVELRVVLLDVRRAVLGAEALDDGADLGAVGDRSRPSRPPGPLGAQGDGRLLEHVLSRPRYAGALAASHRRAPEAVGDPVRRPGSLAG